MIINITLWLMTSTSQQQNGNLKNRIRDEASKLKNRVKEVVDRAKQAIIPNGTLPRWKLLLIAGSVLLLIQQTIQWKVFPVDVLDTVNGATGLNITPNSPLWQYLQHPYGNPVTWLGQNLVYMSALAAKFIDGLSTTSAGGAEGVHSSSPVANTPSPVDVADNPDLYSALKNAREGSSEMTEWDKMRNLEMVTRNVTAALGLGVWDKYWAEDEGKIDFLSMFEHVFDKELYGPDGSQKGLYSTRGI
jgi:hypothetical protein